MIFYSEHLGQPSSMFLKARIFWCLENNPSKGSFQGGARGRLVNAGGEGRRSKLGQRVRTHLLEVLALAGQTRGPADQLLLLHLVGQLDVGQHQDELLEGEPGKLQVLHGRVAKVSAELLLREAFVERHGRLLDAARVSGNDLVAGLEGEVALLVDDRRQVAVDLLQLLPDAVKVLKVSLHRAGQRERADDRRHPVPVLLPREAGRPSRVGVAAARTGSTDDVGFAEFGEDDLRWNWTSRRRRKHLGLSKRSRLSILFGRNWLWSGLESWSDRTVASTEVSANL